MTITIFIDIFARKLRLLTAIVFVRLIWNVENAFNNNKFVGLAFIDTIYFNTILLNAAILKMF